MRLLKIIIVVVIPFLITACGTGKFFIERGVSNIEGDIADSFKGYAEFDDAQEQEIDLIAKAAANWVKTDRLKKLSAELSNIAVDVEQGAMISKATWDSAVTFVEQALPMSSVPGLVERIAKLCYGLSPEQALDATQKLKKDHAKQAKEQAKQNLQEHNKKFARGLKIVFAEMGVSRSKEQMQRARGMLEQRQSHIELQWQEAQRNHARFVALIDNRNGPEDEYVARFTESWRKAEAGAKYLAPQMWEHNARVAHEVMNYLLEDLSPEQKKTAATNIREYAQLFVKLSTAL